MTMKTFALRLKIFVLNMASLTHFEYWSLALDCALLILVDSVGLPFSHSNPLYIKVEKTSHFEISIDLAPAFRAHHSSLKKGLLLLMFLFLSRDGGGAIINKRKFSRSRRMIFVQN